MNRQMELCRRLVILCEFAAQLDCSRYAIQKVSHTPVSYTHLDVYKRQVFTSCCQQMFLLMLYSVLSEISVLFVVCGLSLIHI